MAKRIKSINMNASRDTANAKVTTSGTYQNQLSVTSSTQSSNYDNDTARYYYNLDKMSSSDTSQDIMLYPALGKKANAGGCGLLAAL